VEGEFSGICPTCLAGLMSTDPGDTLPNLRTNNAKVPIDTIRPPLKPGSSFKGLEVLEVLGQGGMGVVYKARQQSLNRLVALKLLNSQLATSEEFATRFEREAKVLASLNHPNVVLIHDFGKEEGLLYLVMEHVDGPTLEDVMKKKGDPARFLTAVRDVAKGLERVHQAGLVHRDVKPSNILIAKDGTAKISDFGLAIETEGSQKLTQSGMFVGTPHYVSPEHAQGKKVDGRSDLYSLGVILFEGFAGRPPFQAPSATALLLKHVNEPPPALYKLAPQSPKAVQEIVRKLLAKNPAARHDTAASLVRDLDRGLEELKAPKAPGAAPKTAAPAPGPEPSKLPVKWIGAGVAAMAVIGILMAVLSGKSEPPKKEEKPAPSVVVNRLALPEPKREPTPEPPPPNEPVPATPTPIPAPSEPKPSPQDPKPPSAVEEALRQGDKMFEEARAAYEDGKTRSSVEALTDAGFKADAARIKYIAVQEIGSEELKAKAADQLKLIQQFLKLVNESRLALQESKGVNPTVTPVPTTPAPAQPKPAAPAALPAVPAAPIVRMAPPEPSTLKEAEKTIRDLYKAEYAKKSPADQQLLAQRLLKQGRETTDDPKARFVLLREARDAAQTAGDLETLLAAVDELADSFDLDVLVLKSAALTKISTSARTPEAAAALAEAFADVARQAVDADNYDVAVAASTRADALAKSSPDLSARIQDLRREIAAIKDEYTKVKASIEKPGTGDQEALGKFYAFVKGDWDRGLEILSGSAKPPLNALAERDLARPGDPVARAEVGDGWWALAEKETLPLRKLRLQDRARLWYEASVMLLSGLARTRVEKRLETLESLNKGPVDLLRYVDLSKDRVEGNWTRTATALVSGAGDFFARVMVPYIPPAEYDLTVVVERTQGEQDFYLGLAQGDYQFGVTLNGGKSTYCEIQGLPFFLAKVENGVALNKPTTVVYQVRKNSVEVRVDGKKVLAYKGDLSKGSMYPQWAVPDKKVLFIGSHGSSHSVTKMSLAAVTGRGKAVRGPSVTGGGLPPPAAARAAIDLLALIDPQQDTVSGPIRMDGTKLIVPAEGSFTRAQIPYLPPAEYDLTVVAERKDGSNSLNLGLVVGDSQAMLVLGGTSSGDTNGLERIEGRNFAQNETTLTNWLFHKDRPVTIVCSVRRGGVTVTVDGRTIIQWKGDPRRLDVWDKWQVPNKKALFVASSGSTYHLHQMVLSPVTGQGTFLRKPSVVAATRARGSVDLLAVIDPKLDGVEGDFVLEGRGLITPPRVLRARVMVPYTPPAEYDFTMVVERKEGVNSLNYGVFWGGKLISLVVDGKGPAVEDAVGMDFINGRPFFENETLTKGGPFLVQGKPSTIVTSIRKGSVTMTIDGKMLFSWKGDPSRVSENPAIAVPNRGAMSVGSYDASFLISQMTVTPVSGQGVFLRKPSAAPKAVDLLTLVDPSRDAVSGKWQIEAGALSCSSGEAARLMVPYQPPEEYDLTMVLSRRSGSDAIVVGLVGGSVQFGASLDAMSGQGGASFLENFDGGGPLERNPTAVRGTLFVTGTQSHAVVYSVRRKGVTIHVDGRKVLSWEGDFRRLGPNPIWKVPDNRALWVGSWGSELLISSIQLLPVTGAGKKLR
jgi:serine/threonine protein kinase